MGGSRHRAAPRRLAARSQACACLVCFAALCQVAAFVWWYKPQHSGERLPITRHESTGVAAVAGSRADEQVAAKNARDDITLGGLADDMQSPRIPRLIHQSWRDGGFPKDLFNWRWQQGLLDLNPGWTLMRWTDESSRELIAQHYSWFLPIYDAYPSYIQRCDASRYFIVHHLGGVYADLDIECSRPFAPVADDALP